MFYLLLLFTTCFLSAQYDYHIVFVHLGDRLPDYLFDAIQQVRMFNDERAEVIILAEQRALDHVDTLFLRTYLVNTVSCESLFQSKAHKKFHKKFRIDTAFRNGYWKKCTERFFYLDELLQQHHLHDVIHLENDNMFYVDIHELLPVFRTYTNIAAPFETNQRCLPCCMYFSKPRSLHALVSYLAMMSSKGWHDMALIGSYYCTHSRDAIDQLPTIMPEYAEKIGFRGVPEKAKKGFSRNKKYERHWKRLTNPYTQFSNKIALFNSLFDAAPYGQFLGGQDPRNGECAPGFINETGLFDASQLAYEWRTDAQGRKVPYVLFDNTAYRINNLHVHSKNLKAFAS